MPLRRVTFVPTFCYHIYNRGSEKRTIFQSSRDYNKFLDRMKENVQKYSVDILCYCLMPNHFHFLIQQLSEQPLTRFMNAVQLGHAKYFNTKYERIGPLFQGRFKAKLIETDEYLLQLSAYIHTNPIADLIDSGNPKDSWNFLSQLRQYPYSSYQDYLNPMSASISKPQAILAYFSKTNPSLTYQSFVERFVPDYQTLSSVLANI